MSEIIEAAIGVVAAIIIVVVGIILISSFYPVNPLGAIFGVILLVIVAIGVVVGFLRSH